MWPVIGQQKAVSLLERSLERAAVAHAYLLVGPRHVGKMTLAITMAQALNCPSGTPPCGKCPACRRIAAGSFADVQVVGLEKASGEESRSKVEISIEQVRDLQHSASLAPFEGKYRVFIIDQAERLSLGAANALLKTIEEPPARVVFILLTVCEEALPATVVSRCQRLELRPLAAEAVERALRERGQIEPARARLLGRVSRGLAGWAFSAASDDKLLSERLEIRDRIVSLTNGGLALRLVYAMELAELFGRDRQKVGEIFGIWREWWRDLMLAKLGLSGAVTSVDRTAELETMAAGLGLGQIRKFIGDIDLASEELEQNASPRLVLEVLVLNIPEGRNG
ncbi:MAG: DNA polymerase III subunit delta' [Chloroflexota bacterium]